MADGISGRIDLFGEPLRETRDGPGRPEHCWSQENSNKINLMFAAGHDVKAAAKSIGISVPTLRKHYFAEVEKWRTARLRLEATQLNRLNKAAEAGSVAADKELHKRVEKGALRQLSDRIASRAEAKPKAQRIGKKEERKIAAAEVKGKFAPPPAPLFN